MKKLNELLYVLDAIFPTQETINPFYKVELNQYPSNYQLYHKLFTHYFTLLYKNHRAMDKARYITSREDIMASLHLLEITILKEHRKEKQTAQQVYKTLKEFIQKDQELTARNIAEIIHYKKTQTNRFIKDMLHQNLLEKVCAKKKNIGYLYKLK
jgi:hypothetical protein